jgi:protein TonB
MTRQGELPAEHSSRDELFRRKDRVRQGGDVNLYPSADKLARIEEGYRKKYGEEVSRGDANFFNTDDIRFGSFNRRLENAIYGVWRYPEEAVRMGIEGVTLMKITFNRKGEIIGKELLQSSGSRILDDEVLRTLSLVGAVGPFPRGYDKETFTLIGFFHYGITGGMQRSLH